MDPNIERIKDIPGCYINVHMNDNTQFYNTVILIQSGQNAWFGRVTHVKKLNSITENTYPSAVCDGYVDRNTVSTNDYWGLYFISPLTKYTVQFKQKPKKNEEDKRPDLKPGDIISFSIDDKLHTVIEIDNGESLDIKLFAAGDDQMDRAFGIGSIKNRRTLSVI